MNDVPVQLPADLRRVPLAFVVPISAVGKARARVPRTAGRKPYTPRKTAAVESAIAVFARSAMKGRAPFRGPLAITLTFDMPVPPSWSKRKADDAIAGRIKPASKPDLSNMVKLVEDAINGIGYADDSQIVSITATKRYFKYGQIHVLIEEAE